MRKPYPFPDFIPFFQTKLARKPYPALRAAHTSTESIKRSIPREHGTRFRFRFGQCSQTIVPPTYFAHPPYVLVFDASQFTAPNPNLPPKGPWNFLCGPQILEHFAIKCSNSRISWYILKSQLKTPLLWLLLYDIYFILIQTGQFLIMSCSSVSTVCTMCPSEYCY